jgi:hypothetical protein
MMDGGLSGPMADRLAHRVPFIGAVPDRLLTRVGARTNGGKGRVKLGMPTGTMSRCRNISAATQGSCRSVAGVCRADRPSRRSVCLSTSLLLRHEHPENGTARRPRSPKRSWWRGRVAAKVVSLCYLSAPSRWLGPTVGHGHGAVKWVGRECPPDADGLPGRPSRFPTAFNAALHPPQRIERSVWRGPPPRL